MGIEKYKKETLLNEVMKEGKRLVKKQSIEEIAGFSKERLNQLPAEYKRFKNPHEYKIGISDGLKELRDKLIHQWSESRL